MVSRLATRSMSILHQATLMAAALLLISALPALSDWANIESPDSTQNDHGMYTSIAVDSNDYPHISYYDVDSWALRYAYYNGTSWSVATVDNPVNTDVGLWTSIAVDGNDHPHISYYDATNKRLKYAHHDGTSWSISVVDFPMQSPSYGTGLYSSICLYGSVPHVSYYDWDNACLRYAYLGAGGWQKTTVDSTGQKCGDWSSIEMGSDGYPRIAYPWQNDYAGDEIRVAYRDGSGWHIDTVLNRCPMGPSCTALYTDRLDDDYCYVSYTEGATPAALRFARGTPDDSENTDWDETFTLVNSNAVHTAGTAIWMDDGLVYIVHKYWSHGSSASKLAYRDADDGEASWTIEQIEGPGVGDYPSLAVDSAGYLHVSYYDVANGRLRYAKHAGYGE